MPSSPVKGGKIIGRPGQGTHAKAFNQRGGSDNWESENAVDIAVPKGTPIYAVTDGVIGSQFGSLGKSGRFQGLRLHLDGQQGNFYYAHLSAYAPGIKPGTHVREGQVIGYSGEANGVAHLHFAEETGDPTTIVTGGTTPTPQPQATTPDASGNVDQSGGTSGQLDAAIQGIPQVGGAPLSTPPLAGVYSDVGQVSPNPVGETWQLIAAQGNVSPDTLRLASLANYSGDATGQQQ